MVIARGCAAFGQPGVLSAQARPGATKAADGRPIARQTAGHDWPVEFARLSETEPWEWQGPITSRRARWWWTHVVASGVSGRPGAPQGPSNAAVQRIDRPRPGPAPFNALSDKYRRGQAGVRPRFLPCKNRDEKEIPLQLLVSPCARRMIQDSLLNGLFWPRGLQ